MTRKEFTKQFAVLGLASPFMASMLTSCNNNKHFYNDYETSFSGKVLIIGAGVAGITAGHILSQKNIDFEILEANSIHGGRVKKLEGFADFPIDIGGEWIHKWIGARPPLMNNLMPNTEADFPTFKDKPRSFLVWKNGELKEQNWNRFFNLDDHKFTNKTWFDFFDSLVTPTLKEKIRFNTPVNAIDYTKEKVVVKTTTGEEFTADKILITVPLKILQDEFIKFEPSLPAEQVAAINEEIMPDGLKIFIEFSKKFYPDMLLFGSFSERITGKFSYYNAADGKNSKQHILGLFAVDKQGKRYTSLKTDTAIIAYVLKELDEIFDGKASKYYLKHHVQNWSAEPFIRGSYSQRKGNPKKMAAPVANKIYFAGEAMNTNGHSIAIHGACESSYLALEKMLKTTSRNG